MKLTLISSHLREDNIRYTNTVNLPSKMIEFGKYTLEYVPPDGSPTDHSIKMSISSEATVTQMLEFFTSFLKASGYYIDDNKELVFERSAPDFSDVSDSSQDFWHEDGISLTGNPCASGDYYISSPVTPGATSPTYIGSGILGGWGKDVISFG
jgi:hypothetical protein